MLCDSSFFVVHGFQVIVLNPMKTGGVGFKHGINVVGFLISKGTFDICFNFLFFIKSLVES